MNLDVLKIISFLFGNDHIFEDSFNDAQKSLIPEFRLILLVLRISLWAFIIAITALIVIVIHIISS